mgnify:CR=1 FL=1
MINNFDSKKTFYQINIKKDPPIIFVHGVGLNHSIWEPQIDAFDNTVIVYDILGHGKTPLVKQNITFEDFSDQLTNLVDELKIKRFHLVGFSIGSLIARNFACKFNHKLESLTLLCSVFRRSKDQQQIVNDRFELAKKNNSLSKQALKRWFTEDYLNKNPKTYEKIKSILDKNDMTNFLKVYQLFVEHKDNEEFNKIKTKTLVITGEEDVGSTPEMSKNLSAIIENSNFTIISKAKHLCSIECPDDVNNAIKRLINA